MVREQVPLLTEHRNEHTGVMYFFRRSRFLEAQTTDQALLVLRAPECRASNGTRNYDEPFMHGEWNELELTVKTSALLEAVCRLASKYEANSGKSCTVVRDF